MCAETYEYATHSNHNFPGAYAERWLVGGPSRPRLLFVPSRCNGWKSDFNKHPFTIELIDGLLSSSWSGILELSMKAHWNLEYIAKATIVAETSTSCTVVTATIYQATTLALVLQACLANTGCTRESQWLPPIGEGQNFAPWFRGIDLFCVLCVSCISVSVRFRPRICMIVVQWWVKGKTVLCSFNYLLTW